jgi:pimeloyl-ACP methyl ester carboxylesterase
MTETVILVPGIGLGGSELLVLAWHLRRSGLRVEIFWKNPWRCSLAASAQALHQMLQARQIEMPHLVAHSLGGQVALQMLRDYPQQRVGRIVLLGTPLSGCLAARRMLRLPGGRWILGEALASVCGQPAPPFSFSWEIGAVAGRLNFLLGLVLCPHRHNDTLVCVEETQHPDLRDHCVLLVSHTSMLLSKRVSARIICFLRSGTFDASPTSLC